MLMHRTLDSASIILLKTRRRRTTHEKTIKIVGRWTRRGQRFLCMQIFVIFTQRWRWWSFHTFATMLKRPLRHARTDKRHKRASLSHKIQKVRVAAAAQTKAGRETFARVHFPLFPLFNELWLMTNSLIIHSSWPSCARALLWAPQTNGIESSSFLRR